ncbi:GNAT family N-acetyltransferase [Aerosakkonema funiforme]|uniref:GNAT family N-acetyltransferase n=1 Tax=Aerosakkonema funiforme TaxID=1246630 RepID=UPI0035BB8737
MQIQNIFTDLPVLETERLLLRKLNWEDTDDIFEYASDPEVSQWTTWSAHESIADTKTFLNAVINEYANHEVAPWGILDKADGKIIGTCGFVDWIYHDDRAEIGYALSRKYWGKGYMTEAVRAILDLGFRTMELNRIEARCKIENIASARVMEKVGMKFEGILREHLFAKGCYHDLKIYAILWKEWD